ARVGRGRGVAHVLALLPRARLRHVAAPASASCSNSSGDASRTPRHLGYLLQPRNHPLRPCRSFIGAPQSGHVSLTATAGFFGAAGRFSLPLRSSGTGLVLRQRGYAVQPRNGPRGPRFTAIGLPHFSHLIPRSTGWIGLPWASTSLAFLH